MSHLPCWKCRIFVLILSDSVLRGGDEANQNAQVKDLHSQPLLNINC